VLHAAAPAHAQIGQYVQPHVNPRPTVSPYLNIFRGNRGAVNYYGIVRPQLEIGRQLQTLQSEVQNLQTPIAPYGGVVPIEQQPFLNMPTTGHPVSFMNTAQYYSTLSRGGTTGVAGGFGNPVGFANPAGPIVRPIIMGTN